MRSALLLSLGFTLVIATKAAGDQDAPLSKDSYAKVRVEVELRGILRDTDKGVTVTARDRLYDRFDDAKELTDVVRATVYTLDFARAKDLRELAKALGGKEVLVVGWSELRLVNEKAQPGGHTGAGSPHPLPSPTWSLQRTVLVTGLQSAPDK